MTHNERLANISTRGFSVRDCTGTMTGEVRTDPGHLDGTHEVYVGTCAECENIVSVDLTARRLLNQYRAPSLLVRELAEAFAVPKTSSDVTVGPVVRTN